MKIIALSDLHGNLISFKDECDIVIIAGDWSPLYCQHDCTAVLKWIDERLLPWMKSLNTKHVIFIAGNHDLACTYSFFRNDYETILKRHKLQNKVHYLCNESVIIDGVKFYGTPNSESPNGWAFSKQYNQTYKFDSDSDVLITHQPPMVGDVGYVRSFNKELGSRELRDRIACSNIKVNICGHIHTGSHDEHLLELHNGNIARIYNVSILDEDYRVAYQPTIIEI